MKKMYFLSAFVIFYLVFSLLVSARSIFVSQIPNGEKFECKNCHLDMDDIEKLNPFGKDVNQHRNGKKINWNEELAMMDSDNDGYTNGQELLDTEGKWRVGDDNPGNINNASNPGDSKSIPVFDFIEEFTSSSVSIAPNPVDDNAVIAFTVEKKVNLYISLLTLQGETVRILFKGEIMPGNFNLNWQARDANARKLSPGIYFVQININGQFITKSVIIL